MQSGRQSKGQGQTWGALAALMSGSRLRFAAGVTASLLACGASACGETDAAARPPPASLHTDGGDTSLGQNDTTPDGDSLPTDAPLPGDATGSAVAVCPLRHTDVPGARPWPAFQTGYSALGDTVALVAPVQVDPHEHGFLSGHISLGYQWNSSTGAWHTTPAFSHPKEVLIDPMVLSGPEGAQLLVGRSYSQTRLCHWQPPSSAVCLPYDPSRVVLVDADWAKGTALVAAMGVGPEIPSGQGLLLRSTLDWTSGKPVSATLTETKLLGASTKVLLARRVAAATLLIGANAVSQGGLWSAVAGDGAVVVQAQTAWEDKAGTTAFIASAELGLQKELWIVAASSATASKFLLRFHADTGAALEPRQLPGAHAYRAAIVDGKPVSIWSHPAGPTVKATTPYEILWLAPEGFVAGMRSAKLPGDLWLQGATPMRTKDLVYWVGGGIANEDRLAVGLADLWGNATCETSGPCWQKTYADCADPNPCTSDLCDAAHSGCFHEPLPDGVECGQGKVCKAGICIGGGP